jgi:hypothetical protein
MTMRARTHVRPPHANRILEHVELDATRAAAQPIPMMMIKRRGSDQFRQLATLQGRDCKTGIKRMLPLPLQGPDVASRTPTNSRQDYEKMPRPTHSLMTNRGPRVTLAHGRDFWPFANDRTPPSHHGGAVG